MFVLLVMCCVHNMDVSAARMTKGCVATITSVCKQGSSESFRFCDYVISLVGRCILVYSLQQ